MRRSVAVAVSAVLLAVPATSAATPLKGTFRLSAGKYAKGRASGSYFRMVQPGGGRKFFRNPDSGAKDKSYTLLRPGSDGGLATGRYQQHPQPPFDSRGNSRAGLIIAPQAFAGIRFGLSTLPTDPQSKKKVPPPSFDVSGGRITGSLQALTAEWNREYFNQGSPKPGSSSPKVGGTYDARTKRFTLKWKSLIRGGPFNGFTGEWRLSGTFRAA